MSLSALQYLATFRGGRGSTRRVIAAAHKILAADPCHRKATEALIAELGYCRGLVWREAYEGHLVAHHQRAAERLANKLVGALKVVEGDVHGRLALDL